MDKLGFGQWLLKQREELTSLLDQLPRYLRTADPQTVNASLRHVLEQIVVDPDGKIELVWR
jgi:hypothetical protein